MTLFLLFTFLTSYLLDPGMIFKSRVKNQEIRGMRHVRCEVILIVKY